MGGASFSSDGLLASAAPTAALVLCTVYQFLVSMVLMSLLTGIMANALMRVRQGAQGAPGRRGCYAAAVPAGMGAGP